MTRRVVAVDPVTSGVSVSRIDQGDPTPRVVYIEAPEATAKFRSRGLHGAIDRAEITADAVMQAITMRGKPDLVIMAKLMVGDMNRDPSGPRRAGLWWEIVNRCAAEGLSVAEYPILAAQRYWGTHAKPGRDGTDRLAAAAQRRFPGMKRDMPEQYRYTTPALAAIGCAAVGIPTALEVTADRLKLLKTGTWPESVVIPKLLGEWQKQHGDAPTKLRKSDETEAPLEEETDHG